MGWIVGELGTILRTNQGGHSTHIQEIQKTKPNGPNSHILLHNYPNPFNSNTKIRFHLSKKEFILLNIYDLLGRKIETLVEKQMEAGYYEILWNAGGLPSGIYLIHLKTDQFRETQKIIYQK